MKKLISPKEYLEILRLNGITPNCWCSEEYFDRAEFRVYDTGSEVWVEDKGKQILFPVIRKMGNPLWKDSPFWADFPECPLGNEFLDYEYIYDPADFLTMKGGEWAVFRKNSRKFVARNPKLTYLRAVVGHPVTPIIDLLTEWTLRFRQIEDAEVLLDFCLNGKNRKVLIDMERKKVVGLNVWDENFKYLIFRYSICLAEPYLAEYMRLLFYREVAEYGNGKYVNDCGDLGNESLRAFKKKMNPIAIRKVRSKI